MKRALWDDKKGYVTPIKVSGELRHFVVHWMGKPSFRISLLALDHFWFSKNRIWMPTMDDLVADDWEEL